MKNGAMFAIVAALWMSMGSVSAQTGKDVVGTWEMVSNSTEKDGKTIDNFGPNPKGRAFFDDGGHFAFVIVRGDLPNIVSNNRATTSAEEALGVIKGSLAYFGTYTVNEANKVIVMQVEGGTFPNWVGTTIKRQFTVSGDQIQLINASPSTGAGIATIVWRRARKSAS